jgi:hypothetical protein
MPSSRSAKEICREFGESDIACKVARKRERRRKKREGKKPEAPPPKPDAPKKPPKEPPKPATERRRYLEDKIREAEEGN